ncbi:MAG: glycerophosphodiester phosphodiesterase [Gammaproteobacteria bacterium]|nr:MAG: glycerophosphodiester phosphodiesterase [Gammaproteobacteria bacterium]
MQTNKHDPIWKTSLQRLRQDWGPVFTTHLAYTALGIILFTPLIALMGRLLLSLSDQPALADQDIAWFLLSPAGIAGIVILAGLTIAILGVEQASLMTMGAGRAQGLSISTVAALRYTATRAHSIFAFAIRLVVRVLLLTLPFLAAAGAIALFLLTDYDINYYLSEQPVEFWIAAVMIGLLLLTMVLILVSKLFAWSMALPLVLFAGIAPAKSFAASERFTAGHRRQLIKVLAIWALLALVLGAVVLGVIQQLGAWVVPNFFDSIGWLVPVLGGFIALWMLGNFVVTVFTTGSLAYVLVAFYEQHGSTEESNGLAAIAREQPVNGWTLSAPKLVLILVVAAGSALLVGNWLLNGIQISDTVTVVAHRGAAGKAPENTLASIRQAIADGTDWVEIDVQETADGEVIVIHDSDFMKLASVNLKVWDGTLEQIRDIDIGSWFDPQFSAERVPTLAEVLDEAKGKAGVVIELKYYGHDQQLEQRVVDIVEQLDMVDEVAIMSLKYAGIQKIRALRPEWTIGLLSATAVGNLASLDVDFLAVAQGMATPGFVRRSREQGKKVFVWTINDSVTLSRMMSLGVDGVITDEPALAREVIAERADLNPAERLLMHTAILFGKPEPQRQYRDDSP